MQRLSRSLGRFGFISSYTHLFGLLALSLLATVPAEALQVTLQPPSQTAFLLGSATFGATVTGTPPSSYQWSFNGVPLTNGARLTGAQSGNLSISNILVTDAGSYSLSVSNSLGETATAAGTLAVVPVIAWGDNSYGQFYLTEQMTNAIAIDCGEEHSLVLGSDGSLGGYANVVQAAAGGMHDVALLADGTVVAWGYDGLGQTDVPAGLSNVVAVAAGRHSSLALKDDGTVVGWGAVGGPPLPLTNVVEISGGTFFNAALLVDGTVVEWESFGGNQFADPVNNIVAISSASQTIIGLQTDGTTLSWVNGCSALPLDGGVNVAAVGAGFSDVMAATADGRALVWGANDSGQTNVPPLLNGVISISGGANHVLALAGWGPPYITKWLPRHLTGRVGRPVFLRMPASGLRPLSYRWYRNGQLVRQGTNDTLALNPVQGSDAGDYTVVISNAFGSVTGRVTSLAVQVPPQITQQPTNQSVLPGGWASFSVAATGQGPLGYQWNYNGTPLTDSGRLSGSSNTTLNITNVQPADAGSYSVVVTDGMLSVTSLVATLDVMAPPIITTQPQPLSRLLPPGTNVTFFALASGSAPLSYQWVRDGVPLMDDGRIVGVSSNLLWVFQLQAADSGNYQVIVTNPVGAATSRVAVLRVIAPPALTLTPQDQTATAGAEVHFAVQAAGAPPLSYTWRRNGQPLFNSQHVSGVNQTNLVISSVLASDQGSYTVVVSNVFGGVTSPPAVLTVLSPPLITAQPQDQAGAPGGTANFSVSALGTTPLTYRWQRDGVALTDSEHVTGTSTANLTLLNLGLQDEASYRVAVSNALGAVTSAPARLLLVPVVAWGWNAMGQTQVPLTATNTTAIAAGGWHTLALHGDGTVAAWGDNTYGQINVPAAANNAVAIAAGYTHSLALQADGTVVAWGNSASGRTTIPPSATNVVGIAAGLFHSVALRADGTVVAWGGDSEGETDVPASATNVVAIAAMWQRTLALRADGTLVGWGNDGGHVIPPEATNVTAIAPGASHSLALRGDGSLLAWGYDGYGQTEVPPAATNVLGIGAGLNHSLALLSDSSVLAWGDDTHGETDVPAQVTNALAVAGGDGYSVALLEDPLQSYPPSLWRQPAGAALLGGDAVLLSAGVRGSPGWNCQWFQGSAALPSQTHAWLLLTNARPEDAGDYWVVVSNHAGSATSSVATVTVTNPVRITSDPSSQTVLVNSNLTFTATVGGTLPLVCQWLKDNQPLADDDRLSGSSSPTLHITSAQTNDSGTYTLVLSNAYGQVVSRPAVLTVLAPPTVIQSPTSQVALVGNAATFTVLAAGSEPLSYQWWCNGTSLADDAHFSGTTMASLTISNVTLADAGLYSVVISNAGLTVTSSAGLLTVWQAPIITTQPVGRSTVLGLPLSLSVAGSGSPSPTYEWRLNDVPIPGATNNTLSVPSVGLANLGVYTVALSNAAAVTVSVPAPVTLGPVAAWGRNDSGQNLVPPGLSNVVMVASGSGHCLALGDNGQVLAWGNNTYGQATVPPSASNVVAIAAGTYHSLALRSDGTVVAWGYNANGQTTVPATLSNVVSVAAGAYHSLALRADGTVVPWGLNAYGQAAVPTGLNHVRTMAGGNSHSLAVCADGSVVAWGNNMYLQTNVPAYLSHAVSVAAGAYDSVAAQADGRVVAWGLNAYGQTNVPAALTNAVAVAAGDYHNLALRTDGTLLAWGRNDSGQTSTPGLSNVVAIAAGGSQNMALVSDGRPLLVRQPAGGTFYTGRPLVLQALASGSGPLAFQWRHEGVDIPDATNATFTLPALSLNDAGNYQVAVSNVLGQALSLPAPIMVLDQAAPFFLTQLPTTQTNNLGSRVSLWLSVDGSGPLSYQWNLNGRPLAGQTNETLVFDPLHLSDAGIYSLTVSNAFGKRSSVDLSLRVVQLRIWGYYPPTPPADLSNLVALASSPMPYLVLRADGTVGGWSSNPSMSGAYPPPATATNLTAIAVGYYHALGLRPNGTVLGWGGNSYGVLNLPPSLTNIVSLGAGLYHNLALRADGTLTAWGDNYYGQLNIPSGATNIVAIAVGYAHNLALRADGTVLDWGSTPNGRISAPAGLSNVIAMAAGYYHSLALKADGTVVGWGFAPGTTVPAGLSNVVGIAAGYSHSAALKNDGSVVVWGTYYQTPAAVPSDIGNAIQIASVMDTSLALFGDGSPHVTVPPYGQTLLRGANVKMVAKAAGRLPLLYQWQCNGTDIPGATTDTLSLSNLQPEQSGAYRLVVSNAYGSTASISANLQVVIPSPPRFTIQPTSLTVFAGSNISWSATATGLAPITYQWFKDGNALPGATGTRFVLTKVSRRDTGAYSVTATNPGGSTSSTNAWLQVLVPQKLSTPSFTPDGALSLLAGDSDGHLLTPADLPGFEAQVSTNLVDWSPLPDALTLTNGLLQLQDTNLLSSPARFYRILEH